MSLSAVRFIPLINPLYHAVYAEKAEALASKVSSLHAASTAVDLAVAFAPGSVQVQLCSACVPSVMRHRVRFIDRSAGAHQSTLETLPQTLFCLLLSGLRFPTVAAGLGAAWVVGRVLYTQGYSTGNIKNVRTVCRPGYLCSSQLSYTAQQRRPRRCRHSG